MSEESPLKIAYSCRACLLSNVKVDVPQRDTVTVEEWAAKTVGPAVAADHVRRSPRCGNRMLDVRVPESGRRYVVKPDLPQDPDRVDRFERRRAELRALADAADAAVAALEAERDETVGQFQDEVAARERDAGAMIYRVAAAERALSDARFRESEAIVALSRATDAVADAEARLVDASRDQDAEHARLTEARERWDSAAAPFEGRLRAARDRAAKMSYRLEQHEARRPVATTAPALFMGAEDKRARE